jgi:hypothetical protein
MSEKLVIVKAKFDERLLAIRIKSGVFRMVDGELEKRCSRCKEYWPADSEFFHRVPSQLDGLHGWCKACYVEHRYPDTRGNPKYCFKQERISNGYQA